MRRILIALTLVACAISSPLKSQEPQTRAPDHYLFAWTGDAARQGNDFLAVIDADPASSSYGQLMTTLPTDQQTSATEPIPHPHARVAGREPRHCPKSGIHLTQATTMVCGQETTGPASLDNRLVSISD